jgi:hypothetical protein
MRYLSLAEVLELHGRLLATAGGALDSETLAR